jgi:hypothetical protein
MAQKIIDRLRNTVEIAGVKKWRTVLRMPMHRATRLMKKIYGNISRFRSMVNSILLGSALNPGNMRETISGENTMPIIVTIDMTTVSREKHMFASSLASSSPLFEYHSENVGTKAEVSAPSAKKRRNILGIWNAAIKASVAYPAPNSLD